jgi:Breast carcinoma amplified sequence 2 (BCAS2)
LQTYGANGWRIQNYLLESTAKQTEKTLEELKELTVEVNRDRKNTQVHASAVFLFFAPF